MQDSYFDSLQVKPFIFSKIFLLIKIDQFCNTFAALSQAPTSNKKHLTKPSVEMLHRNEEISKNWILILLVVANAFSPCLVGMLKILLKFETPNPGIYLIHLIGYIHQDDQQSLLK